MKILIVGKTGNLNKFRLHEEAVKRGHELENCYSGDLVIKTDSNQFKPLIKGESSLEKFDVIYFWSLGYKRWEWYVTGKYLAEEFGTIIVDSVTISDSLTYTSTFSYLVQYQNKLPFPKSALVFSTAYLDSVLKDFEFPLIAKETVIHQGRGIAKVENRDELVKFIENRKRAYPILIREFIPNDGDIRIFTVGYKAIGGMRRIPKEGDFRSNISIGGTGEPFDLDKNSAIIGLAEKASRLTGFEIAGVDIIIDKNTGKPYILEVNYGPGFKGLEKYTGLNVAGKIIEYFEELFNKKSSK